MRKISKSKLTKKLDQIFSEFIRLKSADKNGFVRCVTCNKKGFWKNDGMQCGHFVSRKHYATRWSEENTAVQCIKCNMFGQGEQYKFSLYLGKEKAEKLYAESQKISKFSIVDIQEMIEKYQMACKEIIKKLHL